MLDKNTFGNTDLAEEIVSILNTIGNKNLISNVSRYFNKNNKMIIEISKIKDEHTKAFIFGLYKKELKQINVKVPSHLKDRIICHFYGIINSHLFGPKHNR